MQLDTDVDRKDSTLMQVSSCNNFGLAYHNVFFFSFDLIVVEHKLFVRAKICRG